MYLIWSNKRHLWWRPNNSGYTAFIEEAGRYTLEEAQMIWHESTVNGLLHKIRKDPVTGQRYKSFNDHIVPAPEFAEELTDV